MQKEQAIARLKELRNAEVESGRDLHALMNEVMEIVLKTKPCAIYEMLFNHLYDEGYGINGENFDLLIDDIES